MKSKEMRGICWALFILALLTALLALAGTVDNLGDNPDYAHAGVDTGLAGVLVLFAIAVRP
jgi:hypothetical protein